METSKFRLWQRVLSLVLAAGILCGVMPVSVLAESINDPSSVVVEHQPEQTPAESTSTEGTAPPEQPAVPAASSEAVPPAANSEATPPANSTPASSTPEATPAASSAPADNSAVSGVPADSSASSSVPEEPKEAEQITQEMVADGATITVNYPADAFAEKVTAVATRITAQNDKAAYEATAEALEQKEEVTFDGFAAFDITFFNAAGSVVEPVEGKNVSVSIVLKEDVVPENAQALSVVHVDDAMNTEVIANATATTEVANASAVATFETPSFSTFVVTWQGGPKVTVHYVDTDGNSLEGIQEDEINLQWYNARYSYNDSGSYVDLADLAGVKAPGYKLNSIRWKSYNDGQSVSRIFRTNSGNELELYNSDRYVAGLSGTQATDVYMVFNVKTTDVLAVPEYAKLDVGATLNLNAVDTGAATASFSWSSANSGVVTVSNGVLTGVAVGKTIVTVTSTHGTKSHTEQIEVTVSAASRSSETNQQASHHKEIAYDPATGKYTLSLDASGVIGSISEPARVDVVFVLDVSGSMNESSRLANAKSAINNLMNALDNKSTVDGHSNLEAQYALVAFSGNDSSSDTAYNDARILKGWGSSDDIRAALANQNASGGTNYQAGLQSAQELLANNASGSTKILIFLSDGVPTFYYDGSGKTFGQGNADANGQITSNRYDASWTIQAGSCGEAATTQFAQMVGNFDRFYAVGCDLADANVLNAMVTAAQQQHGTASATLLAASSGTLGSVFDEIGASITNLACHGVSIVDKLSANVEYANGAKLVVKTTAGSTAALSAVGLSSSDYSITYDAKTRTVSLVFKNDYELRQGYVYALQFDVVPSQAAKDAYAANSAYPNKGDANTGSTSAGKDGFYSNDKAGTRFNYIYNGQAVSADYEMPVVQLPMGTLSITKTLAANTQKTADSFLMLVKLGTNQTAFNGSYSIWENGKQLSTGTAQNGMISLKAGQTAKIALPVGTTYQVSEDNGTMPQAFRFDSIQNSNGTIAASGNAVTVVNKAAPSQIKITKTITGLTAEQIRSNLSGLTFNLGNGQSVVLSEFDNYETVLAGSTDTFVFTKVVNNLPAGQYTVTESAADVTGHSLVTTVDETNNGTVTLTAGQLANVSFTNAYTPASNATLSFTVNKAWRNSIAPANWQVDVKLMVAGTGTQVGKTATLNAGAPSYIWKGLDPTRSYSVQEVPSSDQSWEKVEVSAPAVSITPATSLRTNNCNIQTFALPQNSFFLFSATASVYEKYKSQFVLIIPEATDDATLNAIVDTSVKAGGRFNQMNSANTIVIRTDDISKTPIEIAKGKNVSFNAANQTLNFSDTSIWQQVLYMTYSKTVSQTVTNRVLPKSDVSLKGVKALAGRPLAAGEFSFVLTAKDGAPLYQNGVKVNSITVQNSADGSFTFSGLHYTEQDKGTHTYTVIEQSPANGSANGVTYDTKTYTVTVTVSQASQDAPLTVSVKNGTTELAAANGVYALTAEGTPAFTNAYKATGKLTITGAKTLNRPMNAGEFSVNLTEVDATGAPLNGGKTATAQIGADGKFALADLVFDETFDATGKTTHYFKLVEVKGTDSTITYDAKARDLTVVVTDNKDGSVSFAVNGTPVTNQTYALPTVDNFTNSYKGTVASAPITGTKTLVGRTLAADQFTFKLINTQKYKTTEPSKNLLNAPVEKQTVKNAAAGTITFAPLQYTQADIGYTYAYTVTEDNAGKTLNGYTFDSASFTVLHSIRYDLGQKALVVDQTILDKNQHVVTEIGFINTYAASGSTVLRANKTLSGRALQADQFSFGLYDSNNKLLTTVANDGSGNITFSGIDALKYTKAGEYTYFIKEIANNVPAGYTFDQDSYKVVVKVTDNGNGTLTAANTYYNAKGSLTESNGATPPTLTNSYAASGSIALTGTKVLANRAAALVTGEFSVQLQEMDENFTDKIGDALTAPVGADGNFRLPLNYTQDNLGTHYYLVKEAAGKVANVTYDTAEYRIAVTVQDAGNGKLTFAVEKIAEAATTLTADGGNYAITPAGTATFTNTYNASGSFKVTGTKGLNRPIRANEFMVRMEQLDAEGNVIAGQTPITASIGADGSFTLTSRAYTAADIGKSYTYRVSEVTGSDSNITYAKNTYTLTVLVKDAGAGALSFTVNGTENVNAQAPYALPAENGAHNFENSYKATGALSLKGTKSINNRELRNGEFTFTLTKQDAAPLYDGENSVASKTVTNNGGEFVIDGLRYTQEDIGKTYTYILTETSTGSTHVTVDNTAYTIKVTVADSANSNGTLAFSVQTGEGAKTNVSNNGTYTVKPVSGHTATFDNRYADSISMQLTGTKAINRVIRNGEFSFQIEALNGAPLTGATAGKLTVQNVGDKFTFTGLDFTQANIGKTYTYRVTEQNTAAAGVTNDAAVYDVTAAVGYDAANDRLQLTVTGAVASGENVYAITPAANKKAVFVNGYAAEVEQSITAQKTLANAAMTANQFSFTLSGKDEPSIAKVGTLASASVGNPAAKKGEAAAIDFGKIKYTQADLGKTFTYQVSETLPAGAENAALAGVTYDATVFTVKHEVVYDAANDALKVNVTLQDSNNRNPEAIVFANIYEAAGTATLQARKTLSGRPMAAEQFEFALYNDAGSKLQTAKNDAAGNVVFQPLNYSTTDIGKTYTYTIQEKAASADGYTYDAHAYKVEVKVEDAGNGTLRTTAVYFDSSDAAIAGGTAAPISNTYAAVGSVAINGSKLLDNAAGRKLAEDEFSFKLEPLNGAPMKDKDGNPLTELTAKNNAKGEFEFAPLFFDEGDIGDGQTRTASYKYKVTEVKGSDNALTYDNTAFTVVVSLSDEAGNGKLTATWSVENPTTDGAKIVFTNLYETVDIGVTKEWIDNNNASRLRPDSITYHLTANGTTAASATVTENSKWQALFRHFPKYDAAHNLIVYSVTEDAVDYYATEVTVGDSKTEGTMTQLPITVRNTIQLGNLTLEKRLPIAEYNPSLGEAVFTFDVVSTTQENLSYNGIMLQIDENSEVDGDTYVARITLQGIPVGEYAVYEHKNLRYESETAAPVLVTVQSAESAAGASVQASFTNRLTNDEYFSYASATVNVYDSTANTYVPTKVSQLGGTDGVIVIHGGSEEIVTEQYAENPFANGSVILVTDTSTGKVVGGDDDDDDGGATPNAVGPNDPPTDTVE